MVCWFVYLSLRSIASGITNVVTRFDQGRTSCSNGGFFSYKARKNQHGRNVHVKAHRSNFISKPKNRHPKLFARLFEGLPAEFLFSTKREHRRFAFSFPPSPKEMTHFLAPRERRTRGNRQYVYFSRFQSAFFCRNSHSCSYVPSHIRTQFSSADCIRKCHDIILGFPG